MIIFLLIIIAILYFLSWNLIRNKVFHFIASLVTTILIIGVMALSIMNFNQHYGMHKVNHDQTEKLASVSPSKQMKMLIYQPLGTVKKHQVVVYKNTDKQKKTQHTEADVSVTNHIKQSSSIKTPKLVVTKAKWEYKSNFNKMMFALAQKKSTAHTTNTFYVPKDWLVLSANQAKALPKIMKQEQGKMQTQMGSKQGKMQMQQAAQSFIQAKMAQAMQKNPKIATQPAQKAKLMKQLQTEYQAQVKQKAAAQLMPKVMQQLKQVK